MEEAGNAETSDISVEVSAEVSDLTGVENSQEGEEMVDKEEDSVSDLTREEEPLEETMEEEGLPQSVNQSADEVNEGKSKEVEDVPVAEQNGDLVSDEETSDIETQEEEESSIPHQLELLKKIGVSMSFEDRILKDWRCYICNSNNHHSENYERHCGGKKHTSRLEKLLSPEGGPAKEQLEHHLKQIPMIVKGIKRTVRETEDPPDPDTYISRNECLTCSLTFKRPRELHAHQKTEEHRKRVLSLRERFGIYWKNFFWYDLHPEDQRGDQEPRGYDYVIPVLGFYCQLCDKFFRSEIHAKDKHCRGNKHLNKYLGGWRGSYHSDSRYKRRGFHAHSDSEEEESIFEPLRSRRTDKNSSRSYDRDYRYERRNRSRSRERGVESRERGVDGARDRNRNRGKGREVYDEVNARWVFEGDLEERDRIGRKYAEEKFESIDSPEGSINDVSDVEGDEVYGEEVSEEEIVDAEEQHEDMDDDADIEGNEEGDTEDTAEQGGEEEVGEGEEDETNGHIQEEPHQKTEGLGQAMEVIDEVIDAEGRGQESAEQGESTANMDTNDWTNKTLEYTEEKADTAQEGVAPEGSGKGDENEAGSEKKGENMLTEKEDETAKEVDIENTSTEKPYTAEGKGEAGDSGPKVTKDVDLEDVGSKVANDADLEDVGPKVTKDFDLEDVGSKVSNDFDLEDVGPKVTKDVDLEDVDEVSADEMDIGETNTEQKELPKPKVAAGLKGNASGIQKAVVGKQVSNVGKKLVPATAKGAAKGPKKIVQKVAAGPKKIVTKTVGGKATSVEKGGLGPKKVIQKGVSGLGAQGPKKTTQKSIDGPAVQSPKKIVQKGISGPKKVIAKGVGEKPQTVAANTPPKASTAKEVKHGDLREKLDASERSRGSRSREGSYRDEDYERLRRERERERERERKLEREYLEKEKLENEIREIKERKRREEKELEWFAAERRAREKLEREREKELERQRQLQWEKTKEWEKDLERKKREMQKEIEKMRDKELDMMQRMKRQMVYDKESEGRDRSGRGREDDYRKSRELERVRGRDEYRGREKGVGRDRERSNDRDRGRERSREREWSRERGDRDSDPRREKRREIDRDRELRDRKGSDRDRDFVRSGQDSRQRHIETERDSRIPDERYKDEMWSKESRKVEHSKEGMKKNTALEIQNKERFLRDLEEQEQKLMQMCEQERKKLIETRTIELVAQGLSNDEIRRRLGQEISERVSKDRAFRNSLKEKTLEERAATLEKEIRIKNNLFKRQEGDSALASSTAKNTTTQVFDSGFITAGGYLPPHGNPAGPQSGRPPAGTSGFQTYGSGGLQPGPPGGYGSGPANQGTVGSSSTMYGGMAQPRHAASTLQGPPTAGIVHGPPSSMHGSPNVMHGLPSGVHGPASGMRNANMGGTGSMPVMQGGPGKGTWGPGMPQQDRGWGGTWQNAQPSNFNQGPVYPNYPS